MKTKLKSILLLAIFSLVFALGPPVATESKAQTGEFDVNITATGNVSAPNCTLCSKGANFNVLISLYWQYVNTSTGAVDYSSYTGFAATDRAGNYSVSGGYFTPPSGYSLRFAVYAGKTGYYFSPRPFVLTAPADGVTYAGIDFEQYETVSLLEARASPF